VFWLVALGALEACGSRSPLGDFEGVAGEGETGGSGGSLGGAGGTTGGVGYGGSNPTGGLGGAYPMGTGGTVPMSAGGTYPTGGYGGKAMSVGGAYPMGVGGAYPAAGYGGKGMGVGGAMPMAGSAGKGMGTGGKGGGKGDPCVHKGCLLVCEKLESYCEGSGSSCVDECVATGALYPQCSGLITDWLYCLQGEFNPLGECDPDACSGPGCLTDAQAICGNVQQELQVCMSGLDCYSVGELSERTCRLQTYCGPMVYDTHCVAINDAGTFQCTCTEQNATGRTVLSNQTVGNVCHDMNDLCLFPSSR
jgi:hypothetical protein